MIDSSINSGPIKKHKSILADHCQLLITEIVVSSEINDF